MRVQQGDEKFKRVALKHELDVMREVTLSWKRRAEAMEKSSSNVKSTYREVKAKMNYAVAENMKMRRKLYGVTENVYQGSRDMENNRTHGERLEEELKTLHLKFMEMKFILQQMVHEKRVLEPREFWSVADDLAFFSDCRPSNQKSQSNQESSWTSNTAA